MNQNANRLRVTPPRRPACALFAAALPLLLLPWTAAAAAGDVDAFNPTSLIPLATRAYGAVVQPDGKIVLVSDRLTRVNSNATLDADFNHILGTMPASAVVQEDGKIVVAGLYFNRIARYHGDATLDTNFNPVLNGPPYCLAVQADGRILVAGDFTTVNGISRTRIARLNGDGTLDTNFVGNICCREVRSMAVQPDGRIVVGGLFSSVGGLARNFLGRLNADGTVDSQFNPVANSIVNCVAVQGDGKILVGGNFTSLGGQPRNRLGRLHADGTVDTHFVSNARIDFLVNTLALQADERILVGGSTTNAAGFVVAAAARLETNGVVDTDFNLTVDGGQVYCLALQADGKVLVGGINLLSVNGQVRRTYARVQNDPAIDNLSAVSSDRVQWLRGGSAPEAHDVIFELSLDGGAGYAKLGEGTRISGGWELTGLSLPAAGRLRARARTTSGYYNGFSGLVESVAEFDLVRVVAPAIAGQELLGDGSFRLTFTNGSGAVFSVLAATNLAVPVSDWMVLGPATDVGGGLYQFIDPAAATNYPSRYYQLRFP